MSNETEKADRRIGSERRHKPSDLYCAHTFSNGKRRSPRRRKDRRKHLIADSYSSWLLLELLSIFALSIVDAYLTILLINIGVAEEINPVMVFYLGYGSQSFIVMKLLFTAAPLFLLCLFQDLSLTKITLKSSLLIYLSLVVYELSIIFNHTSLFHF